MATLTADRYVGLVDAVAAGRYVGKVTRVVGLTIECRGLRMTLGETAIIRDSGGRPDFLAEAVGFRDGVTILMPFESAGGLGPGAAVHPTGHSLEVSCSDAMLGRVLDALGRPIDNGPPLPRGEAIEIMRAPTSPLDRVNISDVLETGISAIDGPLTFGVGQRVGVFAGSGVGKSTLLGNIARRSRADVNVIALIGERGREVREFIEKVLGPEGLARSVIVVATSDSSPLERFKGAFTATAIAESFRDKGLDVMLMIDSVTRLANSAREIGLASGEPPTVKGYPPSFFSLMPRLVERMGRFRNGSITGLTTVLVDADDMNEPVADTMRGLLDGHVVLSRKIASRGQYPAIDVLESCSRVMTEVAGEAHLRAAEIVRERIATYEDARDLIAVGAYRAGSDPGIDTAIAAYPAILDLLKQPSDEARTLQDTLQLIARAAAPGGQGGTTA